MDDQLESQQSQGVEALASQWCERLKSAKSHDTTKAATDRMREDMRFARTGAEADWDEDKYVANIIQRQLNQTVAGLYARNPRIKASRRKRLDYKMWDGSQSQLMEMVERAMTNPADMEAQTIVVEAREVKKARQVRERVGQTLEILLHHYMAEQSPKFKTRMEQFIRREQTCGVAFLKLGFQRLLEPRPEVSAQIEDMTSQILLIQNRMAEASEGEISDGDAKLAEMQATLNALEQKKFEIVREGLVFDFPRSTEIIIDPNCRELDGFVGVRWVAHELTLSGEEIKENYDARSSTFFVV